MDFNRIIDGFRSGDLYAVCCDFEATIEWFDAIGKISAMTLDDVVKYLLEEEQYNDYLLDTGEEDTYEHYCAIRKYVANDKKQYFEEMIANLK